MPGDHVRAQIGLAKDTTGKVTFIVKDDKDTIIQKVTLQKVAGSADDQLKDFDADLSKAEGAKSIEITTVLTDASSTDASLGKDGAVWQRLRLESKIQAR